MTLEEVSDFGAEELMILYVELCTDLGLTVDSMKLVALELIDAAVHGDMLAEAMEGVGLH